MTGYRLATDEDLEEAQSLAEAEGLTVRGFDFPTLVAVEDDEVVGVLGTNLNEGMIVAGPLAVKNDKPRRWAIVRLIELYDHVMRSLGIESYIHSVDENNTKWLNFIERTYGEKPYAFNDGHFFFVKRLSDGRR